MTGSPFAHLRPWLVPCYFHLGGVTGGLMFLAALGSLWSLPALAPAMPLRDALAMPLLVLCGAILTADLTHPARFWRLLVTFRTGSAVSWGSWILTFSGLVAALASAPAWSSAPLVGPLFGALAGAAAVAPRAVDALGIACGLGLCGYTGVLLTAASRLRWNATALLGGVYLAMGCASASALVLAWGPPDGTPARAGFLAFLIGLSGWLLRTHLEALAHAERQGRLEGAVPPAARTWLARAALAVSAAALVWPFAAFRMGWAANCAVAVGVLAADLCVRFATFWFEEGP